jgi:hypothetical protein
VAHCAADEHQLTSSSLRSFGNRLQPRDIGGKRRHRHAALERSDQPDERTAHLGFGAGLARHQRVGRVAHHGEDTLLAQAAQRGIVRHLSELWVGIELPVAGMHDRPERGADGKGVRFGNGMGDADEFEREGAEPNGSAQRDDFHAHPLLEARLFELVVQQPRGERRRVDGAAQPRPKMRHRAKVVLVAVGQDQAENVLAHLLEEADIRHHEIDAGRGRFPPEQHAAVDDDPTPRGRRDHSRSSSGSSRSPPPHRGGERRDRQCRSYRQSSCPS